MKQIRRRIPSPLYSFPLLIFILILIVVASYFLAMSGFGGVFRATLFNTPQGILLLVVGPLALIVFLGVLLFGIMSDSIRRNRTNRTGNRIFLSFCFVILCATVPQTIIVGRFVSTALRSWFNSSISESLLAATEIADLYMAERQKSIALVADKYFNGLAISNYRSRPVDWMSQIRSLDPEAAACQVYRLGADVDGIPEYVPLIETGDSDRFVPRTQLDSVHDGLFNLESDNDVLRWGQIVRYSNSSYLCTYTSRVPSGFQKRLALIRSAQDQARIIDTLDPYLPVMGVWIFLIFCLPSVLMVIIIAYYISTRLADPVRALQEATARLAEGDRSFRLVIHSRDELAETAVLLNSIEDAAREGKKADKKAIITL